MSDNELTINIPQIPCPECGSPDVRLTDVTINSTTGVSFGGDTHQCKGCGYRWSPDEERVKAKLDSIKRTEKEHEYDN